MSRGRRWSGAEVGSDNQDLVAGMTRGVSLDAADHALRVIFRSNARFWSRQVEPVKFERAKPHVRMRIGESRDHRSPLEVDDFSLGRSSAQDFRVGPHGINASTCDGQRLGPRSFWIAGVDMSVNQNGV